MDFADVFKDLVWDVLLKAVLTSLLGPLAPFLTPILSIFFNHFFGKLKDVIEIKSIKFKNAEGEKAFHKAVAELRLVAINNPPDSKEYREAREEHAKELSKFVRFDIG